MISSSALILYIFTMFIWRRMILFIKQHLRFEAKLSILA